MKKFLNRVSNRIVFRYIVAFFLSSRVPPSFHVPRVYLPMETRALNKKGRREEKRAGERERERDRGREGERQREKEERGRGADPGFERAKKQGGAALGRVRGRVSPPSVGSEVAFRCDEDGRRGAPSRANAPRNAKSKCRCEPSCQPAILQVDALAGHETRISSFVDFHFPRCIRVPHVALAAFLLVHHREIRTRKPSRTPTLEN